MKWMKFILIKFFIKESFSIRSQEQSLHDSDVHAILTKSAAD